jgi:hypothetical protein
MIAIDRLGKAPGSHRAGLRLCLPPGRHEAFALARPNGLRKSRRGELMRHQGHRRIEQVGADQGAQLEREPVGGGLDAELRPQVGPGFDELVFVQRRAARMGTHALVIHLGHGLGQPGPIPRVAPAAGIHIDLHVEHGQVGRMHHIDPGAAGLGPVFDG